MQTTKDSEILRQSLRITMHVIVFHTPCQLQWHVLFLRHAELVSASHFAMLKETLKQVQG